MTRLASSLSANRPGVVSHRSGQLAEGSASVGELAAPFDMTFAAVSKHLRVLEGAGLVSRGRDAQCRPASLDARPLRAAAWIGDYRRFWAESFDFTITDRPAEPVRARIVVELTAIEGGTRMSFTQETPGSSPEQQEGVLAGWQSFVDELDRIATE